MMHMAGDELVDELKYVKKPNVITKHLPKLLQGWVKYQNIRDEYRPKEIWNSDFHRNGAVMDIYKKFMHIRNDESKVTFRSHDNTKAKDLGKKSKFAL